MKKVKLSQVAVLTILGFGLPCSSVAQTNALSIYRAAELEFPMNYGALYQLQATDNLLGTWSNSGPAILGGNSSESFLQSIRGTNQKFWRVVEGSPTNLMDFSRARSLSSTNYILFENVQWQGTNYQVRYQVGSALHQAEMTSLKTFQIPIKTIAIDGSPSDWSDIPVLYSDPQHDQNPPDGHLGTDMRETKIARDATNLYVAFWLYDADPAQDSTIYLTEFQQYLNQGNTPGDTIIIASYAEGGVGWHVWVSHREQLGSAVDYGSECVAVGTKFIEYRIPIADVEFNGGEGNIANRRNMGIEGRFLQNYVHHHSWNGEEPLDTMDIINNDQKVMVVHFY